MVFLKKVYRHTFQVTIHHSFPSHSLYLFKLLFLGPAFLTWQRMANIRGFGGPLSDSWINQQADLQRQILARYADLGMTPVLPAFNGVVPPEMQQLFPTANITRLYPSWNDFPDQYCCNYILSSVDPLFQEIGKLYLEYQVQIFGEVAKSHVYNCDTFNENKPASSDFDYLAGSSSAVYNSMISADPDAVWLMQGWLFVNDPFWVDDNIASYLAGVPDNGMIILDLAAEDLPVWNKIAANKKQFIWCMLHNYGGSRALYGNLTLLATDPISVQQTVPEYFLGTGLTMESIDQNPVVYEFMTEMAFHRSSPDVSDWVQKYAGRRYGLLSSSVSDDQRKSVNDAWTLLFANNYNGETPVCHHPCVRRSVMTVRPAWTLSQSTAMQAGPLADVWSTMIGVGLQSNAFTYDLVDVGRQVISNLFYDVYALAHAAYTRKDSVRFQQISERMIKMFSDWDELLSSHKSYLLGTWIADARSWAKDATEADLFDYNARNQITLWGDVGEIDDYAAKNWGGLVDGYYKKRWELFLKSTLTAIYKNQTLDVNSFNYEELQIGQFFCTDYNNTFPTEPTGSPIDISKNLQKKYGNAYEAEHGYVMLESTTLNGYDLTTVPMWTKNIAQLQFLCDIESSCEGFTTDGYLKTTSTGTTSKTGVNFYMKSKCTQAKC